jgi:hypothetical protein
MSVRMASAIPEALRDLLVKLVFVSSVERGYKLNLETKSLANSRSWADALVRSWYRESRKSLLDYLNRLTVDTNSALKEYAETEFRNLVISYVAKARVGVDNLKVAYSDDPNILSNLEVIIQDWDLQLQRYSYEPKDYN